MKSFIRATMAVVPAAVIAIGMSSGAQAQALPVEPGVQWCNPVIGWGNTPVRTAGGGYAIHQGSYPCPPAAAPVVAPAPAARAQTEYLVFFDWDKYNITPAADRVISDAVAAIGRGADVRVHVIGHTDTSGSPAYNQRLSVRRAESVKSAMVAKGMPAGSITTEGVGENQLLVQTGPNVREPSNRRAQILPRGANAPSS